MLESLFEVRPFLDAVFCRFWLQAKLVCFNEIHQNMKDLVVRDKVEKSTSFNKTLLTKFPDDLSHHELVRF